MYGLRCILLLMLAVPARGADEPQADMNLPADAVQGEAMADSPASDPAVAPANEMDSADATEEGATQQDTGQPQKIDIPRVNPDPGSRRINEVLNYLGLFQRDQEVIKFGDDDSTLSGLYLPENTGTPQGGVLILHDIEQNALWPQTVGPLREYLPDYGWNTLSLFFDDYLQRPLPAIQIEKKMDKTPSPDSEPEPEAPAEIAAVAEAEEMQPNETMDEEPIDQNFVDEPADSLADMASDLDELPELSTAQDDEVPADESLSVEEEFLQAMQLRVEDGLRQLNTLGQFNLVIVAHGLSANWAVASLSERFKDRPGVRGYALILINARASQYPTYKLNEQLAMLNLPLLDIVTGQSASEKRMDRDRRNAITRGQNKQYIQIKLPQVRTDIQGKQNVISRRVRGWLKTHAAGEEVDVKVR